VTRRDYVAIAEAINFYRATLNPSVAFDRDRFVALRELTNILCQVFAEDNRRFDQARFLRACGFEEG
jgi:CTP-dependent riboflavin kinase